MIVLHYRAIPDLREQVRRATNPAADPTTDHQPTDAAAPCVEPEPPRTAEPELVRTARRLGPEAPPRPCRGLNGSRLFENASSAHRA